MGGGATELRGPDFELGVSFDAMKQGEPIVGHAHGEAVVLVRRGDEVLAVQATCTHYGGPLGEGIVVDDTIRCPWHHARFCLRTGEALAAPALNPIACFRVERRDGKVFVTGKIEPSPIPIRRPASPPSRVVIVGGGAAGHAAAEMLRREGYDGPVTLVSAEGSAPVDRPNLSKDYLAGNAPEEWIPLRPPEEYAARKIDLLVGARAASLDVGSKTLTLDGGRALAWDALILATGCDPVRLAIPGADAPHVHTLRTLADSRAIIAAAAQAKRAVVIGASFLGLEAAASLRARGVDVDVVAPDARPLERVLGPELGDLVRALHEEKGVRFHLGTKPASIDAKGIVLEGGARLDGDLVVMAVGVRPNVALAQHAGLAIDRGIVVDAELRTSAPGVWAAGDVARYPDPRTGEAVRIEHWVVAQRLGQIAARNVLGAHERVGFAPFFWSQHYDVPIAYVGHAERFTRADVRGDLAKREVTVTYRDARGRALAIATIGRDVESLRAEVALETGDDALLASITA